MTKKKPAPTVGEQLNFRPSEEQRAFIQAAIDASGVPFGIWYRYVLLQAAGRSDLAAAVLKEHRESER